MKQKNIKIRGVSLAELMVVTAIFTFIVAGLYTTLAAGNVSFQSYETAFRAQQEVRKTLLKMTRDLRAAQDLVIVTNTGTDVVFTFTHPSEGTVTYTWSTTGTDANQVLRASGGTTRIIANNITAFTFSNPDTVDVMVTSTVAAPMGQTSSFQLGTKIDRRET